MGIKEWVKNKIWSIFEFKILEICKDQELKIEGKINLSSCFIYENVSNEMTRQLSEHMNNLYINMSNEMTRQLSEHMNNSYVNISNEIARQLLEQEYLMQIMSENKSINKNVKNIMLDLDFIRDAFDFFNSNYLSKIYTDDVDIYSSIEVLYRSMSDDISKRIFVALLSVNLSKDYTYLFRYIIEVYDELCEENLLSILKRNSNLKNIDKIILAPVSEWSKRNYLIMKNLGVDIVGFYSDDYKEDVFCNKPILRKDEISKNYRDAYIIVENNVFSEYKNILETTLDNKKRLISDVKSIGTEYFPIDIMIPKEDEVFVDVGAYHGETTKEFIEWCNGNYNKIIAFEPDYNNFNLCKIYYEELKNIELYNAGLWSETKDLYFSNNGDMGSKINRESESKAKFYSLDELLDGKEVTFIKMDVEGAELEALKGCYKTIKNYKPRLAISLYHKEQDIIEIPAYIKSINPNYRLYIRHNNTYIFDTILFAI